MAATPPKTRDDRKQEPSWVELVQLVPVLSFAAPFVLKGSVDLSRAAGGFLIGAGLAVGISLLLVLRKHVLNPILVGAGLWLLGGALAFNLPLAPLAAWFVAGQASGLFVMALVVAVPAMLFSPHGYVGARTADAAWLRRSSLLLLSATLATVAWAFWFRGNVRLGGGLPFIALNVTRRLLVRRAP
jgi:hypothetical protein